MSNYSSGVALAATLLLLQLFTLSGFATESGERRALLIGINDYASPQINDLRGAVNDVNMFSRILVTRLGFSEQNIILLTDSQATRVNILQALDQFVAQSGEDDVLYFHYSGHGSRVEDLSGDEDDGLDETILPHDARQDGVPDILDDELEQRFARLKARNALIVFDSCHSGTVTRSATLVQPRFVPPDTRLELYRKLAVQTRQAVPVPELSYVLMTGAAADREALDGPLDEGFYGLFSYALARSLDANGPDATPIRVHEGVRQELRRIKEQLYTTPPEPQLEASAERMSLPILPIVTEHTESPYTTSAARRAWLTVKPLKNGKFLLRNSVELNAAPGSHWGIYGADDSSFDYGDALALGTVERLQGKDAVLKVEVEIAPVPANARAIKVSPPNLSDSLPVQISGVSDARHEEIMRGVTLRVPGVTAVPAGNFARFIVELRDKEWLVLDAGGLHPVLNFPDAADTEVAEQLAGLMSRASASLALLALDNPAADIQVSASVLVTTPTAAQNTTRGLVKLSEGSEPVYRIRRSGEPRTEQNSLMIRIQSNRDAYISIASVDTEGRINLLFPNSYQNSDFMPNGFLRANEIAIIPDALTSGNRAGFHWDYSPPTGTDTIRVFASSDLAVAKTIHRFIAESAENPAALRGLQNELAMTAVRGIKLVADNEPDAPAEASPTTGQWAGTSVVIRVRD